MPTQEERLTALEKTFEIFRRETAAHIQEIDENTTILLGVIRHQGQDIRRIFEHVYSMDSRLDTIDQRLERVESSLNQHTTLLTQILERLPKTP